MKIRIPKLEIRNKPKHSNPIIKIRNGISWNFMLVDHLDLFRFSDFVLLLLFVLGVLCAFAARPVEYRLDQDRVVCQKRYSTGRVIVYPIL